MRHTFYISLCLFGCLLLCNGAAATEKSDKLKPKWLSHNVPESPSPNIYIFVRAHGEGSSLAGAKEMAFIAMTQRMESERGITINTNVKSTERLFRNESKSGSSYEQEITLDITENGQKMQIVCREIDDYWVNSGGRYSVDVLYTVAKSNRRGLTNDKITVTAKYGAGPGFLSIIPGVGQFYKGSILKGSLILGGEIIAAGGIILCENTRASYIKKMEEQPKHAAEYNSLADQWETGRNICLGAAGALYLYNLIDAFVAPGAKYVKFNKKQATLAMVPYLDSNSFGAGLALNF